MVNTVTSFEQMFKDYREPFSFTDEHRVWAKQLLDRRGHRMANWNRKKYLAVLEDLYGRLRGSPAEGRVMVKGVKDAPLVDLDMFVVNCSALSIVQKLLQPPQLSEQIPPTTSLVN